MGKRSNIKKNLTLVKQIISYFLFIIFFSFSSVKAEVVKKLNISGNKRISTETIKIYGEIQLNKNYNEQNINDILNNLYSTEFFEDIQIKIENNTLLIKIKEYPTINQLILIGEQSKKIKDQIKKIIFSKKNKSFIKSKLSKDIDLIKKLYSSLGYNNSEAIPKTKDIGDNNIDLIVLYKYNSLFSDIKFITTIISINNVDF